MSSNPGQISKNHGFLDWWIAAVVVEYLDCRSFAGKKEIWEFNFGQVSEASIHRAVTNERVVVHGILFHNVHDITWKMRAIRRLVSAVPVPLSMSPCDAIPVGPVSAYHFPSLGNPIDVWDPKLNFSSHFQVLDDDQLWQWKIAEFVTVDGRGYGKWVSPDIDIEPLDEVAPRLAELRNPPVRPGQEGHAAFETRVRDFYLWLERLREPIRRKLYQIHLANRAAYQGPTKQVAYVPPILSQFEDFTVRDGKILTRFHAEPIFFRAMVRHCRVATKLSALSEKTSRLDQIYQERVQAVISAAACLEAFVNSVGADHVPSWELYDKLSPEAKWHLCLTVHRQHAQFDPGREPYQTFGKIVELRNRWLHYRKPLEPVRETKSESISWIEARMSADFIAKLPARVGCLICELCEAIKQPAPPWLESGPGWKL